VAFDPTSHKVLTWAEDGTARLWDLYGNRPPVVMQGGDYRVIHASISPNGQMVATSTFLHSPPRVWNATSGRFLFSLGQATDTVPDIEFSSNGSLIATANYNGTVSFWKAATGAPLGSARLNQRQFRESWTVAGLGPAHAAADDAAAHRG
jgi:WD40 repeat protein